MKSQNLNLNSRKGFFLVINRDGFESDVLTKENCTYEAERLGGNKKIVWCFYDELTKSINNAPIYYPVADIGEFQKQNPILALDKDGNRFWKFQYHSKRDIDIWSLCEEWLMNAEATATITHKKRAGTSI